MVVNRKEIDTVWEYRIQVAGVIYNKVTPLVIKRSWMDCCVVKGIEPVINLKLDWTLVTFGRIVNVMLLRIGDELGAQDQRCLVTTQSEY